MKPVLSLLIALLALPRLAAAQIYRVTDLGTLPGGTYSMAAAINNKGHVTGEADTNRVEPMQKSRHRTAPKHPHSDYVMRSTHVFFWSQGKMLDLGGETMRESVGNAINDQDGIAGLDSDGEGDAISGGWVAKEILPGGEEYGVAYGINSKGEIAGERHDYYATTGHHAYAGLQILDGAKPEVTVMDLPFDDAEATGINDAGLVVGDADVSAKPGTKPHHAVLWNKGVRQDLGTLTGGTESRAVAVNAKGQIVGTSSERPAAGNEPVLYHAFLWENGQMRDLGTLPGDRQSSANALNANGDIVGASGERGCLWRKGKVFELNTLISASAGWILHGANGINNRGQIVGTGLHHGKRRGYLLTPKS